MRYIKNYNLFEDNSELYQVVSDEVYGSKIEGIVPIILEEIDIINDMIQEKFEDVSVRKSPTTEFEKEEFYLELDLGDICVDLHFLKIMMSGTMFLYTHMIMMVTIMNLHTNVMNL